MIATHEKIETIALAKTSGGFGTFCEIDIGVYLIIADGKSAIVRIRGNLWSVLCDCIEGLAPQLIDAAYLSLNP
jgi:hypothetical protein